MALEVYKRTGLTGGTTTDLDGIDGATLNNLDFAFVFHSDISYIYQLDASSGVAESSPDIIAPDVNPGTKRWILQAFHGAGDYTDFLDLNDTPAAYAGHVGEYTRVNAAANGLEFNTPAGAGDMTKAVYDTDASGVVDDSEGLETHDSAYHLNRTNHTGTQLVATISDFTTQVQADTHVTAAYSHSNVVVGNPHSVTTTEVGLGNVQNTKVNLSAGAPPNAWDDSASGYTVSSRWIDTTNDEEYVCLDASVGAAVWDKTTAHTTSGSDATALHVNVGTEIGGITEKTNLVGTDLLVIEDSEDSQKKKRVQVGNLISVSTPFSDDTPILADNVDDTKLLRFELASITTGNTRVVTVPDSNITLHSANHDTQLDTLTKSVDFGNYDCYNVRTNTFYNEIAATNAIDWRTGNNQALILTANTTVTFTAPIGVGRLILRVVQDATGNWAITWPATGIKWEGGSAPVITVAASSEDLIIFYYNGTSYYGWARKNFS